MNAERKKYRTDLTDTQWDAIKPLFKGMRNRKWPKREIMNAVLYKLTTGCAWRDLPLINGNGRNDWFDIAATDNAPNLVTATLNDSATNKDWFTIDANATAKLAVTIDGYNESDTVSFVKSSSPEDMSSTGVIRSP